VRQFIGVDLDVSPAQNRHRLFAIRPVHRDVNGHFQPGEFYTGLGAILKSFHTLSSSFLRNGARTTMTKSNSISRAVGSMATAAMLLMACAGGAEAQTATAAAPPAGSATATPDNAVLLTVFLKHDQSRPLADLNAQLAKQGFFKAFPPAGVEVVSWYVTMGIGQVITLRLPASRLREVNRVLEDTAWGSYRTEFYPTYDYKTVGMAEHEKAQ
jgi:hypothetical protein